MKILHHVRPTFCWTLRSNILKATNPNIALQMNMWSTQTGKLAALLMVSVYRRGSDAYPCENGPSPFFHQLLMISMGCFMSSHAFVNVSMSFSHSLLIKLHIIPHLHEIRVMTTFGWVAATCWPWHGEGPRSIMCKAKQSSLWCALSSALCQSASKPKRRLHQHWSREP